MEAIMTDEIFEGSYRRTLDYLENRFGVGENGIDDMERELESLYNYEGLGWAGRSLVKDSEISASIAAYEAFLKQHRAVQNGN